LEESIRQRAVRRYLTGEKPKAIYTDLDRSKKWFFKWLKRYQSGQKDWYRDQSKAPHSSPKRIPEVEKQRIIEVRKRLENKRFAQTGVSAIKWELSKSGHNLPSDRTINRVLKREGLVKKKLHTFPKDLSIPISMKRSILTTSTRLTWWDHGTSKVTASFIHLM
jgi:putative transposase